MRSSPVRDLARRYAAGELSQENYRNQRRAMISAVTSGTQPLTYRDDNPEGSVRPGQLKLLGMAAAAVVVLAVVFAIAWKATDRGHPSSTAADNNSAAAPAAPQPTPGPTLVRGFVETNDWADSSIEDFIREWHKLTADDQSKARGSLLYPRLESELREQIASERAMNAATGAKGDPHLVLLQKMAETLGLTDVH